MLTFATVITDLLLLYVFPRKEEYNHAKYKVLQIDPLENGNNINTTNTDADISTLYDDNGFHENSPLNS